MKDMMVMPRKVGPRVKIFLTKYRSSAISEKDYTAKSDYAQNSPLLPFLAIYYPVVCQSAGLEPKFFQMKENIFKKVGSLAKKGIITVKIITRTGFMLVDKEVGEAPC